MSKVRTTPLVKLAELVPGQVSDFFAQLAEKTRGSTRDNKPFLTCRFRDLRRTLAAVPVWADSPHFDDFQTRFRVGQFFKIRGKVTEHDKYGQQLEFEQIRLVTDADREHGFSERDFIEQSRLNPEEGFAALVELVRTEIKDLPLRTLTLELLEKHAAVLKQLPASQRHAYPYPGGWLEHTLAVTRMSLTMADQYLVRFPDLKPPLNRDVVVAAAALHEIGRVRAMVLSPIGLAAVAGVAGELLGHPLLAYDMIREAALAIPDLKPLLVDLVLHIIVSHPRPSDWDLVRSPSIPEALIVHHADDLDSRFEMFARALAADTGDGPFTDWNPLLGRPLLKARDG